MPNSLEYEGFKRDLANLPHPPFDLGATIMTLAGGGPPTKDSVISNGFNRKKTGVTQADINRAKKLLRQQAKKADPWADPQNSATPSQVIQSNTIPIPKEVTESADFIAAGGVAGSQDNWDLPVAEPSPQPISAPPTKPATVPAIDEDDEEEDVRMADQMINDMRKIYKKMGKKKLRDMMENDKDFMTIVKELMKVEVALKLNSLKKGEEVGGGGFFVVLKGLEDEKPLVEAMKKDKTIDLKQIERAMNPTEELREVVDDDQDSGTQPAEIIKKDEIIETAETLETPEVIESTEDW